MQNVVGDIGEDVENSGEDEPAISKNSFGKPEQDITKTSDEAFEDVLLPAAEDEPEKVNTSNDADVKLTEIAPDEQLVDSSFIAILEETSLEDFLRDIERLPLKTSLAILMKILKISSDIQSRQTATRLFLYCTIVLSPYQTVSYKDQHCPLL